MVSDGLGVLLYNYFTKTASRTRVCAVFRPWLRNVNICRRQAVNQPTLEFTYSIHTFYYLQCVLGTRSILYNFPRKTPNTRCCCVLSSNWRFRLVLEYSMGLGWAQARTMNLIVFFLSHEYIEVIDVWLEFKRRRALERVKVGISRPSLGLRLNFVYSGNRAATQLAKKQPG